MGISPRRLVSAMFMRNSRRKLYGLVIIGALVILLRMSYRSEDRGPDTGSKYRLSIMLFGEKRLPLPSQTEINYIAENLVVNYKVLDNFISQQRMGERGYHLVKISLYNKGSDVILPKRWEIYANVFHKVEPYAYPYPDGFYLRYGGLKVKHVGGRLYKFEPVGGYFQEIKPGENIQFQMKLSHFQVARTDSFPRWYVSAFDRHPRVITSTDGESLGFLENLIRENQVKRRVDDPYHPLSASERYNVYRSQTGIKSMREIKILPTPLHVNISNRVLIEWNTDSWTILESEDFKEEVDYLKSRLKMKNVTMKPSRRYIQFVKDSVRLWDGSVLDSNEAYSISTDPFMYIITITASTKTGTFNGIQTFLGIVYSPEASSLTGIQSSIPAFDIVDSPRFSYRGLHLDVVRNFHQKTQILKLIEVMAMYKLNKLHLHLSDDEGWRLEIPGLPELTQIGSKRCHDPDEEICLLPQLGSGPHSNTSGSGYYNVQDYQDILKYAKLHHIEVIPEFDMPGHSRAAIKSIHAKSQKFKRMEEELPAYSIVDESDQSKYMSGQLFTDDAMNPCMTSTYTFVDKVFQEVKKMHKEISPLKLYHFGGDEVANGAWSESEECQILKEKNLDLRTQDDLMAYFVQKVARITALANVSLGSWEDGMMAHVKHVPFHRQVFNNRDIYVYVWKGLKVPSAPHRARLFANTGYKVVLSYGSHLYFDQPYEPDPEERGLYWATRSLSTHKAWSFTPGLMQADVDMECPRYVLDKTNCINLNIPSNIAGMEAHVWTETIRTSDQLDYMLFPRLLAVAERAWHEGAWENMDISTKERNKLMKNEWTDFIDNVGNKELRRLSQMGIQYRIPPPGAVVTDGRLSFKNMFPGMDTEYYSNEDNQWKIVSHNMKMPGSLEIRSRSPDGQRYSQSVTVFATDVLSSSTYLNFSFKVLFVLLFVCFFL